MAGEAKLRIEVMADGTAKVSGELAQVAGATARVGAATSGASRALGGLMSVGRGVGRMMGGLARSLTSMGGMIGIGLGGAAIKSAIDNLASFDAGMTTLQHSAGASKTEMQAVGAAITDMAAKSGRPKAELLGAVDAAVDLGMKMQDVVAILQDASNWARLLGVDTTSATTALASMGKLAGPNVDRKRLMAITDVGVGASGMDEAQALQLIGRLAPMMRGQGVEGEAGVTNLMRMFAGVGQFASNPREMVSGVKGLMVAFRESGAKLAKMGVDTSSVGAMFRSLAGVAHNDAAQLKRMGLSDSLVTFITAAGEGYDQIVKFDDGLANLDLGKFGADLAAAGESQAASWDKIKVQAAELFAPAAGNILQWLADEGNQNKLRAAFQTAGVMLEKFGGALAWLASLIEGKSKTGTGSTGYGVGQVHNIRGAAAGAAAGAYESAAPITPEERAFLVSRAEGRARRGEAVGPTQFAEDLSYYGRAAPGARRGVEALQGAVPDIVRGAGQLLQNIIHIHVDPETVHAETDARNGARSETTVTQE
jgi:hypothetical protein